MWNFVLNSGLGSSCHRRGAPKVALGANLILTYYQRSTATFDSDGTLQLPTRTRTRTKRDKKSRVSYATRLKSTSAVWNATAGILLAVSRPISPGGGADGCSKAWGPAYWH